VERGSAPAGVPGNCPVLRLPDGFGFAVGERFLSVIRDTADGGSDFVVIELEALSWLHDYDIHLLTRAMQIMKERGGNIILSGLPGSVERRMEKLGILRYFEGASSTQDALRRARLAPVVRLPAAAGPAGTVRGLSLTDWEVLHRVGPLVDVLEWFSRPKTHTEAAVPALPGGRSAGQT
jgi:anti-anti-sigma regulatory factor